MKNVRIRNEQKLRSGSGIRHPESATLDTTSCKLLLGYYYIFFKSSVGRKRNTVIALTYLGGFFSLGGLGSFGGFGSLGFRGFFKISSSSSNVSAYGSCRKHFSNYRYRYRCMTLQKNSIFEVFFLKLNQFEF
jgi:hypothetical protein